MNPASYNSNPPIKGDPQTTNYADLLEDVFHELKGPMTVALRYADSLVAKSEDDSQTHQISLQLRGILRKAKGIVARANLIAAISAGNVPSFSQSISIEQLIKIVLECCKDIESLHQAAHRGIKIHVDMNSLRAGVPSHFSADAGLLEQAVFNIMDNALKYSFPNTTITVRGVMKKGDIVVEFANRGIPVQPNEVPMLMKRGWRGAQAQAVTGEGAGLGLWISSVIANAHGGAVSIKPTTDDGITTIALSIPTQTKESQI